jgi:hypothetical protein
MILGQLSLLFMNLFQRKKGIKMDIEVWGVLFYATVTYLTLFHSYAFGQVFGFIRVNVPLNTYVVGQ